MRELVISGWNVGLDKILLTKALRAEFGYSLSEGKSMTDRVLAKEEIRIPLGHRSIEEEQALLTRLREIGVQVSVAA